MPTARPLTDVEARILEFERKQWKYAGDKHQAIVETFGLTATRYFQLVNGLLDRPEALAAQPVLVNRLRRIRDQKRIDRRLPAGVPR